MVEKLVSYGTIISISLGGLVYLQTNFVDAMDFKQYQYEMVESEVNYLKDKELRMQQQHEELDFEDKRQLERQELKLDELRQQLGK